jgi:hypothetical protein
LPPFKKSYENSNADGDAKKSNFPKVTYDLGVSVGSNTGVSYNEANLGLNLFFSPNLSWRNSLFSRFGSNIESTYGLDTGARLALGFSAGDAATVDSFLGAGYRIVTPNTATKSAPFAEAGLQVGLLGLRIGGGAKVVLNNSIDSSRVNETQYFLILSGGGRVE